MQKGIKQEVLVFLEQMGTSSSRQLCEKLGISRQALNLHIRELINTGKIFKTGTTRSAQYHLTGSGPKAEKFNKKLQLASLDESKVYDDLAMTLNLKSVLSSDQETIMHYAFTEMLNNAIDHSKTDKCEIAVSLDAAKIEFKIRENGIGVFHSIASMFSLEDEHAGMIELIKGKTTTMPAAHSGEGIFFTSNAADKFTLRSHNIQLEWDKFKGDVFVSQPRYTKGTMVHFILNRSSRTKLDSVFSKFAPKEFDFEFSKTKVMIKLLKSEYISRSEAKRLVFNLDKFREVELDFKSVSQLGQGFADEVFRIFAKKNPMTTLKTSNTNSSIRAMINHAINSAKAI
jgi:anti-sigma regulatory factor (Ser/Thr protein kinase)/biotin operon repressor